MDFPYTYFEDEVREGFYISGNLKRAWAAQLEVLAEIDKVCKKHDIRWFIDCGTLLGAVRHGGYVPWDDDMDICMFRDDLIKFNRVAPYELPKDYVVLNMHKEDEDFLDYLTRVTNSHAVTFYPEYLEKYHNCPYSVGIDIFPLDYLCPDDEEEELRRELAKKVMAVAETTEAEKDDFVTLEPYITEIEELCRVEITRDKPLKRQLYKLVEALFSMYTKEEAAHVALMTYWVGKHNHKYPIECFDETVMLPFEKTYLPAPMLYEDVLTVEYRDFMTIFTGGGVHEYPFYKKQEYHLIEALPSYPFIYKFDPKHLENNKLPNKKSKQNSESYLLLVEEAHGVICKAIALGQGNACAQILCQCQENAIRMGEQIEADFYEGHKTVLVLEEYCELLYQINQMAESGELVAVAAPVIEEALNEIYEKLSDSIKLDVVERKEILFIPFRACYWDGLESIWQAKVQEENCDVYVMPIPYYEREVDGTLSYMHYEGEEFPEYVSITNYKDYDIVNRHPDVIYIQNPYDECNFTTCVEPEYFSRFLKRYTEELIYIPYFVMDEIESKNSKAWVTMEYFCTVPGLVHADKVILQSEKMREMYIERLTEFAGEDTRTIWENKIEGSGSPIYEAKKRKQKEEEQKINQMIPSEWKEMIYKENGDTKKIIFFETGISIFAKYGMKAIDKIKRCFDVFINYQSDVTVLWRLRQEVWKAFEGKENLINEIARLVNWYKQNQIGIYDDMMESKYGKLLCDAYYGDSPSTSREFFLIGKPVLIINVEV
ncbi:MAG: LicD family protein [Eubacteriales bacterium]|nr:LicD family protein [Eubacteriales bacterium]